MDSKIPDKVQSILYESRMTPKLAKNGQLKSTKNGILYFTEYQVSRKDGE
jgi:hypothetical protein